MPYEYRDEVLRALLAHGLKPKPGTPPARLREAINDLYRFELRRLREQYRRREIPRERYFDLVVQVRKRYRLLSLPVERWTA